MLTYGPMVDMFYVSFLVIGNWLFVFKKNICGTSVALCKQVFLVWLCFPYPDRINQFLEYRIYTGTESGANFVQKSKK